MAEQERTNSLKLKLNLESNPKGKYMEQYEPNAIY